MPQPLRTMRMLILSSVIAILVAGPVLADPPAKQKITKADDLPQHAYPVSLKATELLKSREAILELAAKVKADTEADLAAYDIADDTTLQNMYGTLLTVDLLQENWDAALGWIEKIRKLEDKEAAKLTTGLSTQALIVAKKATAKDDNPATYRKVYAADLHKRLSALPWDVVQDEIQNTKGRVEIFSENFITGIVQAQLEPIIEKTGELNSTQAASILGMYFMLTERLPLKTETINVYQKVIDANRIEKPDIWAARSVTLDKDAPYKPILISAWDSGTDPDVFKDIVYVNPGEKLNGKDDDGNGFIDDIHGVAYDIHANRSTGDLYPLGDAKDRISQIMKYMKGFTDLQSAIDSPEASDLKKHLAGMASEDVAGFIQDLSLAGDYSHGTHVAGIMVEGNPFARLLIARLSYDHHIVPVARTEEWGERDGDKCRDTVEYLKQHGVRVVNMSWGESQKDAESSLEKNGIGATAEERREIARKVFASQKKGLYEAIKNAPEILFVCAAGNSDNDVEFDEYIPSSFDLPNLLTVGAVDQAGEPTSFTSTGKVVQVYANGFEVDSYVPGGKRMKMSGTSMASPNAANLAAKILTIDPSLTPPQVIELIKKGADTKTDGKASFLLMNPKKTIGLMKK